LGDVLAYAAFEHQEAVEAREAREVAGDRRRRESLLAKRFGVASEHTNPYSFERPWRPLAAPADKAADVAAIGGERVRRDPALGHQVMEEQSERVAIGFGTKTGRFLRHGALGAA